MEIFETQIIITQMLSKLATRYDHHYNIHCFVHPSSYRTTSLRFFAPFNVCVCLQNSIRYFSIYFTLDSM